MNAYADLLVYLLAIIAFVGITLWLNRVLGPKPAALGAKLEPFECGATAQGDVGGHAVPVKYYGVAIVFVLFDLETVFLYIWALGAQPPTMTTLAALGVFLGLLVVIMLYVWSSGLIEEVTR